MSKGIQKKGEKIMLEYLDYLFSPKKYFQKRREARFQRQVSKLSTSYIISCAEQSDNLQEGAAKILFLELSKRVKESGIPLDDWL